MPAEVGHEAPELTLVNNQRQPVTLADLKGTPAVLVFFPGAFTGGCQPGRCRVLDHLFSFAET